MDRIETPRRDTGPETVGEILRRHAERTPDALAYRFLTTATGESWNYRELDLRARAIAAHLQRENLRGRPVLLLHPPGLEYVANFLGCLYAGAIAVPAYPPDTGRFRQTLPRLAAIARDSRATHALTTGSLSRFAGSRQAEVAELGLGELRWLATDEFEDAAAEWRDPGGTGGTLAFLQYTSGSTSTPKGVMVSNENLLANLRAIHLRLEHDRDSGLVSWLPPYHDMGLIGGVLTPLYGGFPAHLMAPMTFVQRPMLWLETISTTRASTAIAPNFGFDYCLRRIKPEQRDGLDLRHWRLALNGAEPVRADTLERFADYFAPCGFDRRALSPCYGLAEATLIVTGVRAADRPDVAALSAAALEAGTAEPARAGERTTRVVACGPAADGFGVAIVDPQTGRRVPDGRVGEIWATGPSVARGYWRRPEDTRETFHATLNGENGTRYLRTGDLGFERDGELYVAGRTKDVVIVQGRNHYPQDVELTVEKAGDVIRANSGAAFGIPVDGAEELVVAYEVDGRLLEDADALLARLRTAIAEEHEVSPHAVVLLKRSAVRKTTSGKIQRQACREAFLGFELPVVAASVVREFGELNEAGAPGGARVAVAEVLGGAEGRFADLGVGYPGLLDAVRTLERRLGRRVPIGPLLADPRAETLVTLLGGDAPPPADPDAPERSLTEIEAWLTARVADRIGLRPSTVEVTRPFATLGLDSKKAVAILEELGAWLGRELAPGVLFDHPTIRDLAAHLAAKRIEAAAPAARVGGEEPIAVVGLGCRFPGAPDVESYWRLLLDGRDAISEVPSDRWDADAVNAPRFGGFVDHVGDFDARFFGISAREAVRMDPQQRLLLEIAWQTLE
ncbi:MAG: AMP-binding protein, partial [Actinoallomurus sp.]